MKSFHSGVPMPAKRIAVVNKSAKLTPRQNKFASGLVKTVNKSYSGMSKYKK